MPSHYKPMEATERQEIQDKIETLIPPYEVLSKKMNHIQDVMNGLENLLKKEPRNTDCTTMSDSQIATAKSNLFEFADAFINE